MAFFEKKHKKRPMEAKWPKERYETEEDLKAMLRAKKIDKDLSKKHKVRNLAREKVAVTEEERERPGQYRKRR